jgi:hypothetical protein
VSSSPSIQRRAALLPSMNAATPPRQDFRQFIDERECGRPFPVLSARISAADTCEMRARMSTATAASMHARSVIAMRGGPSREFRNRQHFPHFPPSIRLIDLPRSVVFGMTWPHQIRSCHDAGFGLYLVPDGRPAGPRPSRLLLPGHGPRPRRRPSSRPGWGRSRRSAPAGSKSADAHGWPHGSGPRFPRPAVPHTCHTLG